ncbi:hypothetical protein E4T49_06884 [Aureobasidium sp. EXF-10728]|nr:hypothetical protein E4T49_06884 [Aureobasidium sp. EXF-10728]
MAASEIPTLSHLGSVPQSLFSGTVAVLAIAWFSVILRIYVRSVMMRSFGMDDWTIMLAITALTVQCAYLIKVSLMEMQPDKYNNVVGISTLVTDIIAFSGSYALDSVFLKISLGFFFLRIIIEPWQRAVIYICMAISTIYGFIYFGIVTFGCGDPEKFLIRTVQNKCISITDVIIPASYVHTALNATTDWIMALLPIVTIWKLNMPRITKFWAYLLLALGAAGSIVSLIRFGYVEGLKPGKHFIKQSAKFALYSTIEPGLGITAVNFATLRPLFKKCLEGAKSVSQSQTSRSGKKTPSSVPDIQLKGLPLSRSRPRDGFRAFGSSRDEDSHGWTEVSVVSPDLEKAQDTRWPQNPRPL